MVGTSGWARYSAGLVVLASFCYVLVKCLILFFLFDVEYTQSAFVCDEGFFLLIMTPAGRVPLIGQIQNAKLLR